MFSQRSTIPFLIKGGAVFFGQTKKKANAKSIDLKYIDLVRVNVYTIP